MRVGLGAACNPDAFEMVSLSDEKGHADQSRDERGRFSSGSGGAPSDVTEGPGPDADKHNLAHIDILHPTIIMGSPFHPHEVMDYLAKNGAVEMDAAPRPKGMRKQADSECYRNASQLVISDPERYKFVEGIAYTPGTGGLAFMHAWAIDTHDSNRVVDCTWKDPEHSRYYGVTYDSKAYMRHAFKSKFYGVLGGDMKDAREILKRGHL